MWLMKVHPGIGPLMFIIIGGFFFDMAIVVVVVFR